MIMCMCACMQWSVGEGRGGLHMHECVCIVTMVTHCNLIHYVTCHHIRQHFLIFYKENIRFRNVLTFQVKSRQFI